ncbi:MAG: macro domain-containing protein [Nitrospira sp.]
MNRRSISIHIAHGSILDVEADAIVNAANSSGVMGDGVAGAIKRAAGQVVEDEARRRAPIVVGKAVLTSGGATKFRGIIHAPTMPQPGIQIPAANVGSATKGALIEADAHGLESIAVPGMGTGVGGVSHRDAAAMMIGEIKSYSPRSLKSVILVDVDEAMVAAWKSELMARGPF